MANGVNYQVAVQTPQYRIELDRRADAHADRRAGGVVNDTRRARSRVPRTPSIGDRRGTQSVLDGIRQSWRALRQSAALGQSGRRARGVAPEIVNHYNVQPVFDVYANVDRRDLGAVAPASRRSWTKLRTKLPEEPRSNCAGR